MTPIQYFDLLWERANHLKVLHEFLDGEVTAILEPDELLRSEWIARVSALDLYIHESIAQNMLAIFEGRRPTSSAYLKYQISIATLSRIQSAASSTDASSAFDLDIRQRHDKLSFQAPDKIADGIRLISDISLWSTIVETLGAPPAKIALASKDLKRELSLIVMRRNKIAHEGDLLPGAIRTPLPISRVDLDQASNVIDKIVRTIDIII